MWILAGYERTLSIVLRHQFITLLVTLGTIAFTGYLYVIVPKGFFPQQDTGRLIGNVQADQNISYAAMEQLLMRFADGRQRRPGRGQPDGFHRRQQRHRERRPHVRALKPLEERKLSARRGHRPAAQTSFPRSPAARLFLQGVQDLRVGGRASSVAISIHAARRQPGGPEAVGTAGCWAKCARSRAWRTSTRDQQNRGLQAGLTIDRVMASILGISTQAIDDTLYDAFGQRQVSTMYMPLNQYHVVLEVEPDYRDSPNTLRHLYVRGQKRRASSDHRDFPLRRRHDPAGRQSLGTVPFGDDLVQSDPWRFAGRRRAEDRRGSAKARHAADHSRQFPRHRPGVSGLAQQSAAADPGRAGDRVHRAGHSVRELHPSDHDSLDAPFGGRRRAAGACCFARPS